MTGDELDLLGVECALPAGYPTAAPGRPDHGSRRAGDRKEEGPIPGVALLLWQALRQRRALTILPSTSSIA
jgi:hypothetical protein